MIFVYSQGDEFCTSTFSGNREIALANGYKEVTEEMYAALQKREAHWVDGELVERVKPQSEIDEEKEAERLAKIDAEIAELKAKLADTDYEAIKHSEGWISDEDYAVIKAQRQAWRDRINELEEERGELNGND